MTDQSPPPETPRPEHESKSMRVPLEREVVLKFEHFSSFIHEYSANISLGGMFIKTREPKLRGSLFRFEMRLQDGYPLVVGLAKVLWVRNYDEGPDRPTGMGVQFLRLEPEGRRLIERIVEEHAAQGGTAFEVQPPAGPEGAAPGPARPGEAVESAPAGEVPEVETPAKEAPEVEAPAEAPPATVRESGPPAPETGSKAARPARGPRQPPLEELLSPKEPPRRPAPSKPPPPGPRPRTFAARPRLRLRPLAAIALVAAVVAGVAYVALDRFGSPEPLGGFEARPRSLPRPSAPPAEPEEAAPPPEPRAFSAVEEITWRRRDAGAEVLVRLDGPLEPSSWSEQRLDDPPRQLVRLKGVSRPYPTRTIAVGVGGVRQLRTGYHRAAEGNELHLVVDLASPDVELRRVESGGSSLSLLFAATR